jgi:hypothetical protein
MNAEIDRLCECLKRGGHHYEGYILGAIDALRWALSSDPSEYRPSQGANECLCGVAHRVKRGSSAPEAPPR